LGEEAAVWSAVEQIAAAGFPKTAVYIYCLIGFDDTPEDAQYRLGAVVERGYRPFPMRYQPLDALEKNSYVHPAWTHKELDRTCSYYANLRYTQAVPFAEYQHHRPYRKGQLTLA